MQKKFVSFHSWWQCLLKLVKRWSCGWRKNDPAGISNGLMMCQACGWIQRQKVYDLQFEWMGMKILQWGRMEKVESTKTYFKHILKYRQRGQGADYSRDTGSTRQAIKPRTTIKDNTGTLFSQRMISSQQHVTFGFTPRGRTKIGITRVCYKMVLSLVSP